MKNSPCRSGTCKTFEEKKDLSSPLTAVVLVFFVNSLSVDNLVLLLNLFKYCSYIKMYFSCFLHWSLQILPVCLTADHPHIIIKLND